MAFITDPSTGNDTVTGTDLADTFVWRGGNDTYEGGGGGDTLRIDDPEAIFFYFGSPEQLFISDGPGPDPWLTTSSVETYEFLLNAPLEKGVYNFDLAGSAQSMVIHAAAAVRFNVLQSDTIAVYGSDFSSSIRGSEGDNMVRSDTSDSDISFNTDDGDDMLEVAGNGNGFSITTGDGDDTILIETEDSSGRIDAGDGIDRLIINAALADVGVAKARSSSDARPMELSWNGNTITIDNTVDLIEFADITEDGSPLVLSYAELSPPVIPPITGTDAGEVITDLSGDNRIEALGGNDWINMVGGKDTVDGGAGTDMISFAGRGDSRVNIDLSNGIAVASIGLLQDRLSETLTVNNIENVTGTSGFNTFRGDAGTNWFRGLGGSDRFYGSAGGDLIDGGSGSDRFSGRETDDTISLLRGRVWDGEAAGTRLSNIEWVFGGGGDDTLTGDHGGNVLNGEDGDDVLMGNGGNDQIYGGDGTDVAVFGYAQDQYDVIQHPTGRVTVDYTGAGAGDGFDSLVQIQILRFADGDMIL